jgi:hypothetical protein
VSILLNAHNISDRFPGVRVFVPPGVVLGTDIFDRFMDLNGLRSLAMSNAGDEEIAHRFLQAKRFPRKALGDLAAFLDASPYPLAVRSSSLLEDSQYYPFAGVYATYMLPNNHRNRRIRLQELVTTIKRVYASTYSNAAKDYMHMTSFRLEEEKMAVIIQRMVGTTHETRFYPDFSGVARSYNFYPVPPQEPLDGIVSVALGLGKTIADGGRAVRFSPKFPNHVFQFSSTDEALTNNQTGFFALQLDSPVIPTAEATDLLLTLHPLSVAEHDGPLGLIGSTYSAENDTITEGLSRQGTRLVTFAPLLRQNLFPLPEIVGSLLRIGSWGMGTPVEIEFAVNCAPEGNAPKEFGLLQIRPLALTQSLEELDLSEPGDNELLCRSDQVLGNGIIEDIYDIVVVDLRRFDRSLSLEVAKEVSAFNEKLLHNHHPYLLVGVGRWGSLDPWLGIPVKWEHICGARAIVEGPFLDIDVSPSQGSHFFQNITSFQVGYFTVNPRVEQSFIDWEWLLNRPPSEQREHTRHLRFDSPLVVKINGHEHRGIILKPRENSNERRM